MSFSDMEIYNDIHSDSDDKILVHDLKNIKKKNKKNKPKTKDTDKPKEKDKDKPKTKDTDKSKEKEKESNKSVDELENAFYSKERIEELVKGKNINDVFNWNINRAYFFQLPIYYEDSRTSY